MFTRDFMKFYEVRDGVGRVLNGSMQNYGFYLTAYSISKLLVDTGL